MQLDAPAAEYVPAEQLLHATVFPAELYVPALHCVQSPFEYPYPDTHDEHFPVVLIHAP